jgi:uncharacterized SAM-binding protein YcdF (DUF218 family)
MTERDLYQRGPEILKTRFSAIVVCGFGEVPEKEHFEAIFGPNSAIAFAETTQFVRAAAARLLVDAGAADTVITSGGMTPRSGCRVNEAQVLRDQIVRYRGEPLTGTVEFIEEGVSESTILNIIYTLNILDVRSGGRFTGQAGYLTSRFHVRRLAQMARILGLENEIRPVAAEGVLSAAGIETGGGARSTVYTTGRPVT